MEIERKHFADKAGEVWDGPYQYNVEQKDSQICSTFSSVVSGKQLNFMMQKIFLFANYVVQSR